MGHNCSHGHAHHRESRYSALQQVNDTSIVTSLHHHHNLPPQSYVVPLCRSISQLPLIIQSLYIRIQPPGFFILCHLFKGPICKQGQRMFYEGTQFTPSQAISQYNWAKSKIPPATLGIWIQKGPKPYQCPVCPPNPRTV